MNNMIFWIIVCFWLIPMGIRMCNRSRMRRMRNDDYRSVPGNPPGQYNPEPYNPGPYTPGRYDPRPYDPSRYPPSQYSPDPYGRNPYDPVQPPVVFPTEPQHPAATPAPPGPASSSAPPADSAPNSAPPQGYRARKLAELDQQYSDGKIAMEDYMRLRQEIMNG